MAPIPNSNHLPPETAHMLSDLEDFLDTPPLCREFRCNGCHNFLASECQFIQDLYPFSMTQLLFDNVVGVTFGEADRPSCGVYAGEYPAGSHVDMLCVYCVSCGAWVGWKIMRLYENYHPVIRPFQYILACGGAIGGAFIEAVFS